MSRVLDTDMQRKRAFALQNMAGIGGPAALLGNRLIGRLLVADQAPPQMLWWALTCIGLGAAAGLPRHRGRICQLKEHV